MPQRDVGPAEPGLAAHGPTLPSQGLNLPRGRSRLLVALAFVGFISLGLPDGLLSVAWPSIRATFALPLDALGALLIAATGGYMLASFNTGRLLRHLSIGTLLSLSAITTALAWIGYALTPSWPLMVALGFVAGLAAGAIDAGLNIYVANHHSARTMNWLHACYGIGTTLGPLIMTSVLTAGLLWRSGYGLVGAAQLLLALTYVATRKLWKSPTPASADGRASRVTSRETLRQPTVWLGIATFFVYAGIEVTAGQWAYSVLTLARAVPAPDAGLWLTLYWGSLMTGRIAFGAIVHRFPLAPLLRGSMLVALIGAVLFTLNFVPPLSLILIGLGLAPIFPSLISTTPARLGPRHASHAIGYQIAAAGLGVAILPASVGVVSRSYGLDFVGYSLIALTLMLWALYEAMPRPA